MHEGTLSEEQCVSEGSWTILDEQLDGVKLVQPGTTDAEAAV